MLFNYRYVTHDIEKFQAWMEHLVKEVWCKATGDFRLDLLDPELQEIVQAIADDNQTKLKLFEPIRDLFDHFKSLSDGQRAQFSNWYDANNNIEALCANSLGIIPVTYSEMAGINAMLAEQLKAFYTDLWDRVLGLGPVKSRIGSIDAHYRDFVRENDEDKCPYCGFGDLKGQHYSKREAYDHFLPKGIYPFNSVNFKNLAPMCHECNSSYKLKKDPVRHIDPLHRANTTARRKAFYSYANAAPAISIGLTLSITDINNFAPTDITLAITCPGRDEEVESWKDVFGIEERYKAKCCAKNDGKYWLVQALDECANAGKTAQEIIEKIVRNAAANPWAEANFLKKPFLLACQNAGLV